MHGGVGVSACRGRGVARVVRRMVVKAMAVVRRVGRRDVRRVMGWALCGVRCKAVPAAINDENAFNPRAARRR